MKLKCTATNGFSYRINKFINGILMVMLDLGTVISSNILVKVVDA